MLTVDHYESIRRAYHIEGKSRRQIARELGHSRKTVSKALKYSTPPPYSPRRVQPHPVLGHFTAIVDRWLEEDRRRPRKQRHTMRRIYERLKEEHGYTGSYVTVTRYINKVKPASQEVYAPLSFALGEEGQVDWGQAKAILDGEETTFHLFCMRSCASGASFVRAYRYEDQVCFLDGHVRAFEFFDGVFGRLAYDNLKTAVVCTGKERRLTDAFRGLRSHYLFETRFCNFSKGNEKGHVENLVKYAQRNFMTPLPEVASLDELNRLLLGKCRDDLHRKPSRSNRSVREKLDLERSYMLDLPPARFSAARDVSTFADKESLVRVDTNCYSVPVDYAHRQCVIKVFAERVEVRCGTEVIADHKRAEGRHEHVLDPMHYLPLLERKVGAFDQARPLQDWRLPGCFAVLRRRLEHELEQGTREYSRVLRLLEQHPMDMLERAVEQGLAHRVHSRDGIAQFIPPPVPGAWGQTTFTLDGREHLRHVQIEATDISAYTSLLTVGGER